ncbi:MAG: cation diffusion facilitator family transporter [Planctomycetes bacterium]|nr:cation diffusion facilitator family transporter [Planctomycetota bacterium]
MSAPTHRHGEHENHGHEPDLREVSRRRLWWATGIILAFLIVEVIGGLLTGSLALLADAGHMLTDVLALGLALFVGQLARRPATPERTFGFLRAEVIGAFINGATLLLVVGLVFREAIYRFLHPPEVQGAGMVAVACAGLLANLGSAGILAGSRKENINIEGAFVHMLADTLGSMGAVGAGVVILLTGWTLADPLVSLLIGLLILWSGIGLLRRTLAILIQATPAHLDFHQIKAALEANRYVAEVHDLHIWSVTLGFPVLTANIWLKPMCSDPACWQRCLRELQDILREQFDIDHATLQLEPAGIFGAEG